MSDSLSSTIKKQSATAVVMGILTAVVGAVMIFYPLATATVTTIFLGWSFIIAAFATFVFAFQSPSAGPFFLNVLIAILYGIAGVSLVLVPPAGVLSLTMALGIVLVIQGGIEFGVAIQLKDESAFGWVLIESLLSAALGVMILFEWPFSSTWAIGTMLGVAVLCAGITRIVIGATVHYDVNKFEKLANA